MSKPSRIIQRQEKHRPPRTRYEIEELIQLGRFHEAEEACDDNVDWYERKAESYRDLLVEIARHRLLGNGGPNPGRQ